jgi:Putative peptidoglycan binding domain
VLVGIEVGHAATLDATPRAVKNGRRVSALDRAEPEARSAEAEPVVTAEVTAEDLRAPTPRNLALLQRLAGNRATASLVRVLARLGTPLSETLPAKAPKPKYGEDPGEQRRYSRLQYTAMWEAEQGRPMTWAEHQTIRRGCIGISAQNIGSKNPPVNEVYSTFAKAKSIADARNATMERYPTKPWVVFAIHFWSNQAEDRTARESSDPTAFLPDADGKIDLTGYYARARPGFVNFDFGFWDEVSGSIWHANHYEKGPSDPMKVYQSTMGKFAKVLSENGETRYGYRDFDREGWGVAQAAAYEPTRASRPKLTSPRLAGDKTIERVFKSRSGAAIGSGSPSSTIKKIQQMLLERGYDLGDFGPSKDGVDGKYGDKTVDAVKQFRVDENLGNLTSGKVDRIVLLRLDELFPP